MSKQMHIFSLIYRESLRVEISWIKSFWKINLLQKTFDSCSLIVPWMSRLRDFTQEGGRHPRRPRAGVAACRGDAGQEGGNEGGGADEWMSGGALRPFPSFSFLLLPFLLFLFSLCFLLCFSESGASISFYPPVLLYVFLCHCLCFLENTFCCWHSLPWLWSLPVGSLWTGTSFRPPLSEKSGNPHVKHFFNFLCLQLKQIDLHL